MSYSEGKTVIELTRLVDISAADQTLPFIVPFAMTVYGFFICTTEAWGTIDTGTVTLSDGATLLSTATPVTSGAVGTCYEGTEFVPEAVADGDTLNVGTTTDASQAGTAIAYIVCEIFPTYDGVA
jgi:hypothetical protein